MNKFLPSIYAASAILVFFLLVLPAFGHTRMLNASIKEREGILKEAEEISNRIIELNSEIEAKRSEIDKLDRLLPKEKEVPELLSSLESIVSSSGLVLTEMNLSEVSDQNDAKKINGTLKMTGSYGAFVNFLNLVEKNLRLIDVMALDVAAQSIEGSRAVNYDVRFEVNYLPSE